MIQKEDYLKAKQIVQEYEKQLNISVVSRHSWECNECGFKDYTDAISEDEIHSGLLSCSNCGGDEFHLS